MDREELISFLHENLSVDVNMEQVDDSDGTYIRCQVSLHLNGEQVSSSSNSVMIEGQNRA